MMRCPHCGSRRFYVTDRRYVSLTIVGKPDLPDYTIEEEEVTETEFVHYVCSTCDSELSYGTGVEAWRKAQAPAPNPYY